MPLAASAPVPTTGCARLTMSSMAASIHKGCGATIHSVRMVQSLLFMWRSSL